MAIDIIDFPEKFCFSISGLIPRPGKPPLIFQKSHGALQKKIGPIIPANPRTRVQQLNRILFRAAMDNADALSETQKDIFRALAKKHPKPITHRMIAVKEFLKSNHFNNPRFGANLFSGGKPQKDAWRFGEIAFNDAFLTRKESLPLNKKALQAKFPNINIDSLFPEE
jgi:hypothetical protein